MILKSNFCLALHHCDVNRFLFITTGCLTCCCPPISNMLLAEKMGLEGFEYKYLSLFDYVGGGGICTFISTMLMRDKVRERYNIEGSTGGDCCIAFCCTSCAICQMRNQVDETVEWSYAIFYKRINVIVHHFNTNCLVLLNFHYKSFCWKKNLNFLYALFCNKPHLYTVPGIRSFTIVI